MYKYCYTDIRNIKQSYVAVIDTLSAIINFVKVVLYVMTVQVRECHVFRRT
jgi:hypothetical protein